MNFQTNKKSVFIYALSHFQEQCAKSAAYACLAIISTIVGLMAERYRIYVKDNELLFSAVAIVGVLLLFAIVNKIITRMILWLEIRKSRKESLTMGEEGHAEPRATGKKIAILIPRLTSDADGSMREHIISFILNDIGRENVEILRSRLLLAWDENSSTENQCDRAIEEGREMLISRGADMIIWGRCFKSNALEMVDLHFTTRDKAGATPCRFEVKNMSLEYAFTKELINNLPKHRLLGLTQKYRYEGHVKELGEQRVRDLYESTLKSLTEGDTDAFLVKEAIFDLDEPKFIEKTDNLNKLYKEATENFSKERYEEAFNQFKAIIHHPDFDLVNHNQMKLMIYNRTGWDYSQNMVYWYLSTSYMQGLGTQKDEREAFYYACKDAETNGSENAAWRVVEMCEKGIGTQIDAAKTEKWRKLAVEKEQKSINYHLLAADTLANPELKGDQLMYAKKHCAEALENPHMSDAQKERVERIMQKVEELKIQFNISDEAMMFPGTTDNKEAA